MSTIKETATEVKVKAAAVGALVTSLVVNSILAGTVTDFVSKNIPDAFEVGTLGLIAGAVTFVSGWATKNVSGKLAPSTIAAVQEWLRKHGKI